MSNNNYNDIELTEAEIEALENPEIELELETTTPEGDKSPSDDKASEQETATDETSTEEVTEPEVADSFEIDGKEYSRDQILQWRDDSDNKENWQKSNTEKAQQLSKWNKLAERVQNDEAFRNHLKDYYQEYLSKGLVKSLQYQDQWSYLQDFYLGKLPYQLGS